MLQQYNFSLWFSKPLLNSTNLKQYLENKAVFVYRSIILSIQNNILHSLKWFVPKIQ